MANFLKISRIRMPARRWRAGIASLPAILLFGGIILEMGIAGAFLVFYLNNSLYGTRLANEALLAAQTGLDDALLKIILDKTCPNATCPAAYTLESGNGLADVTICKNTCSGLDTTQITSVGRALTKRHKLVSVVNIDPLSGLISVNSVKDTAL